MQRSTAMWPRASAACGAVGAVLFVAGAFTAGSPLRPDAATPEIVTHLSADRDALLGGYLLSILGVALLIWFVGYLVVFVASTEGERTPLSAITLASWVGLLAVVFGGGMPLMAVVWSGAGQIDPGVVRFAFDGSNLSLYSISAPIALISVLAPTIAIWRSGSLPRWLAALGVLEMAVNAVELVGLFSRSGDNAAGYAFGVGPVVWAAWVACVSIAMVLPARSGTTIASARGTSSPAQ